VRRQSAEHLPDLGLDVIDAVAGQQVGWVGLPGGQAGDPVQGLGLARRVPVQVVDLAVDAEVQTLTLVLGGCMAVQEAP